VARDQRTRLNAELAHQYGRKRGGPAATPGRNSLTGELDEMQEGEVDAEVEEQEAEAPEAEQVAAPEQKKSLFELPRKEPSRQPLPSSPVSAASKPGSPPPAASAPAPSAKPKDPRRG